MSQNLSSAAVVKGALRVKVPNSRFKTKIIPINVPFIPCLNSNGMNFFKWHAWIQKETEGPDTLTRLHPWKIKNDFL